MSHPGERALPRPVVVLAVALTATGTAWAMWQTGFRGPVVTWGQADNAVEHVWGPVPSHHDMRAEASNVRAVTMPGAPAILAGSRRPHADRGACTRCHTTLTPLGTPVPNIHSFSVMPHTYRGVCSNCHQLSVGAEPMQAGLGREGR